ncbi:exopolyphosphatase [Daejeonella sp.]|uniref:Ppx/GppA phosphatase family protein n=1 Tax=Daejeonella sp. TaxID=2805397 RepID=UPI00272748F8|nr:exopolyphosphatase [Daejeonella sp.]MDO8992253.1 exopolyphosphatase [Daejeonella sp.]MDP2415797.1 exopolyphosphatase [Daejeonella sp.]
MSSIAILDLGTNTFQLLIANIIDNKPVLVFEESIAIKLGEGGIEKGYISEAAFDRGLSALKQFKKSIDQYQVKLVRAAATSALRSASNGAEFLDRIKSETGIVPEIITGEREADLIYLGVKAAINLGNEKCLIIDIGGGSVEFIICNQEEVFWKRSYDIGAARLMEQFHHSDPISEADINELNLYLGNTLSELKTQTKIHKPDLLIGSAGAFETFATLIDTQFKVSFTNPEIKIELRDFAKVSELISKSSHAERSKNPAIIPVRVDMIVMSTLITKYVLNQFAFKALKLSTYSLKEGLLFEFIKNRNSNYSDNLHNSA